MITFSYESIPTINELEKDAILAALRVTNNNKMRAAVLLGICIRSLRNKLYFYRLDYLVGSVPFKDPPTHGYWGME
jgi:DNA-binding NtrC family response regulator